MIPLRKHVLMEGAPGAAGGGAAGEAAAGAEAGAAAGAAAATPDPGAAGTSILAKAGESAAAAAGADPAKPATPVELFAEKHKVLKEDGTLDLEASARKQGESLAQLEKRMGYGGARRRDGTIYVGQVKDSTKRTRLVPFIFNEDTAYMLELGNLYMRVFKNGVLLGPGAPTAYSGATAYVPGNLVSSGGVNYYCIANTTGNAPPNVTYWYAMPAGIYEIPPRQPA